MSGEADYFAVVGDESSEFPVCGFGDVPDVDCAVPGAAEEFSLVFEELETVDEILVSFERFFDYFR